MKKNLLSGIMLLFSIATVNAQTINTVAGNGTAGNSGNGGPATAAELYTPYGVFVDAIGNLFIADQRNHEVKKVGTNGTISVLAGNGNPGYFGDGLAATSAQLNYPSQVYVAASGNVFIADEFNSVIRMVNTNGIISTVAGTGIGGYNGDGVAATTAELNFCTDVTFDPAGNMYIAEYNGARIRKVTTNGIISTIAGTGVGGFSGDGSAATAAKLNHPYGVTVAPSGVIYLTDNVNERVREIDLSGNINTIVGNGVATYAGDGGPATNASINNPFKVNTDNQGNIYIADISNSRIRLVTNGIISTIAGTGVGGFSGDGGPATAAALGEPGGVFPDQHNNTVYIGDNLNNRVRAFTFPFLGVPYVLNNDATVKVYPNPSHGLFNLEIYNSTLTSIVEVYSILGEKVYSGKVAASNLRTSIDLSNQPAGVYLLKIADENGARIFNGKLVIN